MVFTDPPYGTDYVSLSESYAEVNSRIKNIPKQKKKYKDIINDDLKGTNLMDFLKKSINIIQEHSVKNWSCYMCFGARSTFHLFYLLEELDIHFAIPLVWDKGRMTISWNRYHPDYEMIAYFGPGSSPTGSGSVWYGPNNETTHWRVPIDNVKEYEHPTQKPVELPARAIRNSSKTGDIILDLFLGSGSTLIACEQTNRVCYACDIEPAYIDVTIARWENLTGKKAVKLKN